MISKQISGHFLAMDIGDDDKWSVRHTESKNMWFMSVGSGLTELRLREKLQILSKLRLTPHFSLNSKLHPEP